MTSIVKRREFCKAVPAAMMGILTCPFLLKTAGTWEEDKMEKKVKHIEVKVASVKGTCALQKVGDVARVTEQGVEAEPQRSLPTA